MHHFGLYRSFVLICIVGLAVCPLGRGTAYAEEKKPIEATSLGVADVDRILSEYWRTPRVKEELERYRSSREFQQRQQELAELERELGGRRFAFFQRQRATAELQQKRNELQALAEKDSQRIREREKEAIERLIADIRMSAEAIGSERQLTAIFDSNAPHILFIGRYGGQVDDITESVIEDLNF